MTGKVKTSRSETYRGAVLARVAPVPVLGEMLLGTGLALRGRVGGAVALHGRTWRALIARQELGGHGVAVLVRGRDGRLLEGPGERSREELRGDRDKQRERVQRRGNGSDRTSNESHVVHRSSLANGSKCFFFLYSGAHANPKLPLRNELKERSEL